MATLPAITQPILGGPSLGHARIRRHLERVATRRPAAERDLIAASYVAFGALFGIGDWLPYAQGVHESDYWGSWWWVNHFNPAGLGVTGATMTLEQARQRGAPKEGWVYDPMRKLYIEGWHYDTPAHGILSQLAHLLAYAFTDKQLSAPMRALLVWDPRLPALERAGYRGAAPTWDRLAGRWAVGALYTARVFVRARQIEEATR